MSLGQADVGRIAQNVGHTLQNVFGIRVMLAASCNMQTPPHLLTYIFNPTTSRDNYLSLDSPCSSFFLFLVIVVSTDLVS